MSRRSSRSRRPRASAVGTSSFQWRSPMRCRCAFGRPPQKVFGVGFISEGFDSARPFRRMPDSWHRRASWMLDGIEGEIIGDFGLAQGAAGGIEIDRYDLTLGTPPHSLIIASSGGHSDNYQTVVEEVLYPYPGLSGSHDYRVRADMVYFTSPQDGAAFSTGSIAFSQSLPYRNFDNNVSISDDPSHRYELPRVRLEIFDQFVEFVLCGPPVTLIALSDQVEMA
ncbi:N,N-dimethylformamidase beta subunit family domain-containing protein [Bradyrhizobium sp. 1]|uniref:N,N-dimethylformamidase beta subunit family domain-containing protein n=1 Tax=Bradyrhizobium sp. 1 TaxID=241591 RepID=UPI003211B469